MRRKFKVGGKTLEVRDTVVDRVVGYFSPVKGRERLQARVQMALANSYAGASRTSRSLRRWNPGGNSADSDILPEVADLRERSRDLLRNTPLATGAINSVCTSVVGPGLKLQSTIDRDYLGLDEEQADEWEQQAERLWNVWASSKDAHIGRMMNFHEIQDLALRSTLENGDAFVLLPYLKRGTSPFGLKCNIIEADRISNPNYVADSKNLVAGIELDGVGAPKACHILKQHPGARFAFNREWDRVMIYGRRTGMRKVLHLMTQQRAGQTRGVPYLAPVIEALKMISDYTEAELQATLISSFFTVFVKSESQPFAGAGTNLDGAGESTNSDEIELVSGGIVDLNPGETIETADPGRPNESFDQFVMAIMRQVGVALEIPYEILIKHFTASYSASRAALLEAWRFFNKRRGWLIENLCQPVYEAFIAEQVAEGRLDAPGFFDDPLIRAAYVGSEWIGRPQGQIDPLKENKADEIAEDRTWKTTSELTAEKTGGDWRRKIKTIKNERLLKQDAGVSAAAPQPLTDQEQQGDEGPDNETT